MSNTNTNSSRKKYSSMKYSSMKYSSMKNRNIPAAPRNSAGGGRKKPDSVPSAFQQIFSFLLFLIIAVTSFCVLRDKPDLIGSEQAESYKEIQNPAANIENYNNIALKQGIIEEITQNISSTNAILINLVSGRIICEKNSDAVSYPASLTKILSAIIAIENIPNPNSTMITVSRELVDALTAANSSMAGFSGGETVSATDLFYGCLLASGGEATATLATYVAGSEEEFVSMMNKKAKELGCGDTNFVNVTGLHNHKHTSTVKDIASIFKYALENDTFREIVTSAKYYTTPTEQHPYGITLTSTVYAAFSSAGLEMDGIVGGKTGYTLEARQCLASYYTKGEERYLLITFGAGNGTNTTYDNAKDAAAIYKSYAAR